MKLYGIRCFVENIILDIDVPFYYEYGLKEVERILEENDLELSRSSIINRVCIGKNCYGRDIYKNIYLYDIYQEVIQKLISEGILKKRVDVFYKDDIVS